MQFWVSRSSEAEFWVSRWMLRSWEQCNYGSVLLKAQPPQAFGAIPHMRHYNNLRLPELKAFNSPRRVCQNEAYVLNRLASVYFWRIRHCKFQSILLRLPKHSSVFHDNAEFTIFNELMNDHFFLFEFFFLLQFCSIINNWFVFMTKNIFLLDFIFMASVIHLAGSLSFDFVSNVAQESVYTDRTSDSITEHRSLSIQIGQVTI